MTNEEEKILEEDNDITLEEAAEEAEELQEETQDEGRAIEIPVERREDVNLEDVLERQVLRGGLRDAADTNMIHTHLDNFLAKIVGETPVDNNVRNSLEYWLNEIANAGFSTMQDLSSAITDVVGLTYDLKKAYKQGNVVTLTIRAKNGTGNTIGANTALFTLSGGIVPNKAIRLIVYANDGVTNMYINSNNGECNIPVALTTDSYIILSATYAVA